MRPARLGLVQQLGTLTPGRVPEIHIGVVQSVQAGPPKTVTITVDGGATQIANVRYLGSYTPAAGDNIVAVLLGDDGRTHKMWLVAGTLA